MTYLLFKETKINLKDEIRKIIAEIENEKKAVKKEISIPIRTKKIETKENEDNPSPDERPPKEWFDYAEREIIPSVEKAIDKKLKDKDAFIGWMWFHHLEKETKEKFEKMREEREKKEKKE